MYLVGFIIRIYHDARSPERQRQYLHRNGFFFVMVTQCVYCEMRFSVTNNNFEHNKKSRYSHAPTIRREMTVLYSVSEVITYLVLRRVSTTVTRSVCRRE